jgi:hypothetical protein
VFDNVDQALSNSVVYKSTLSTKLDSISPRYGTVVGGTSVTFTGTQFSANKADYVILIDNIACTVSAASTTSVTCTTGSRPGLHSSTLSIIINGKGEVST